MNEYVIGAGAVLTAGARASISRASLHAQTDPRVAAQISAAAIDFESASAAELSRVVIVAAGWGSPRFESDIVRPLLARGECTLVDVFETLARETGASEIHLFARWSPDDVMAAALRARGVALVAHPIEAIEQAALVSGQRVSRWRTPFRAA